MAFISDATLKSRLADWFGKTEADLDSRWDAIITQANLRAYGCIIRKLTARGYTAAQIASWDDGIEYNTDQGLYYCFIYGMGVLHNYPLDAVNIMDRCKELDDAAIIIGGVLTSASNIVTGPLDDGQVFPVDPNWDFDSEFEW